MDRIDPDGTLPDDERVRPARDFRMSRQADGSVKRVQAEAGRRLIFDLGHDHRPTAGDPGLMWKPSRRPTVDGMIETSTPDTTLSTVHAVPGRRAGDVERTAICEALAEHYVSGRLSRDELENRLGWAVRAVTEEDLRRLIDDLPVVPVDPPRPNPSVDGGQTWPASVVIAVVALIVSVFVAGGMLLVLGAVSPLLFIGACLGGGAAVVVGASGGYLLTHSRRSP